METLENLFLEQVGDIYYAEKQLVKALPKMAKLATHDELKDAFQSHLAETEAHVKTVEEVFKAFGVKAKARKCQAILGLIKEGDEIASNHKRSPSLDAALICAAQKVEHYEIATYGSLREWAQVLGNDEAASMLQEVLNQEKTADNALTELALAVCNPAAEQQGQIEGEGFVAPRRGIRPEPSRV